VNRVLLTGRLTRDPEMRSLASGKTVTQFSVATNEYIGQGKEKAEYQCKVKVYPSSPPVGRSPARLR
jgi:single-stranded DNA-binding protein